MQTPVVSSFMGRESGGEQREWAQWGALAGSACSRGEERRGGGGGERQGGGGGDKGGEEEKDSTVQDRSVNSRLFSSQPHPQPTSSLWPTGISPLPPPFSLHLLSSSLALICLPCYLSSTPHQTPIPGAGR